MAGSSTHSLENYNTQTMEHHQILMNTEVMKHFTILNRASVREIMLRHEKTFKEQVHDLHKLYEVQRLLMHQECNKGSEYLLGASQPASHVHSLTEEESELKRKRIFWDKMNNSSRCRVEKIQVMSLKEIHVLKTWEERTNEVGEKTGKERKKNNEDTPRSTSSPVRKRSIDLEQLPEDDTDDEPEKSEDITSLRNIDLQKDVVEFPMAVPADIKSETESNLKPQSGVGQGFLLSKEPGSKTKTMLFLQAESGERTLQETGKQNHWLFQGSKASTNPLPVVSSGQQRQELAMQPVLSKALLNEAQHIEVLKEVRQGLVSRHLGNKPTDEEDASNIIEKWAKASANKSFQELSNGPQEEVFHCASQKESENGSKWFPSVACSKGYQLTTLVPAEPRVPKGHATPSWVVPAISTTVKGNNQDSDANLWYPQNPFMQFSQNQQQAIFQPQMFPFVNEEACLKPSQSLHRAIYPQQVVYGIPATDTSQIRFGVGVEGMQNGQGGASGTWNMLGLGHHYSNMPSAPPKPPFRKPPKLVLTNDGLSMELKLASPESDSTAKASQEKILNSFKKDQQESSKMREKKEAPEKISSITDPNLDKVKGEGAKLTKKSNHYASTNLENSPTSSRSLATSERAQSYLQVPSIKGQDIHNASAPSVSNHRPDGEFGVHQAEGSGSQQVEDEVTMKTKSWVEGNGVCDVKKATCSGHFSAKDIQDDRQRKDDSYALAVSGEESTFAPCKDNVEGSVIGGDCRYGDRCDSNLMKKSALSYVGSWKSEGIQKPSNPNSTVPLSEGKPQPPESVEDRSLTNNSISPGPKVQDISAPKIPEESVKDFVNSTTKLTYSERSGNDVENDPEESVKDFVNSTTKLMYSERSGNDVENDGQLRTERSEEGHYHISEDTMYDEIVLIKSQIFRQKKVDGSRDDLKGAHKDTHKTIESKLGNRNFVWLRTDHPLSDSPTSSEPIVDVATANSVKSALPSMTKQLPQGNVSKCDDNGSDLMSSASQLIRQAISTWSNNIDMPANFIAEPKDRSSVMETIVLYKDSGKNSSSNYGKDNFPSTTTSGEISTSLPSSKHVMSNRLPEITMDGSDEGLEHSCNSDSLAATILLSLAPKLVLQNPKECSAIEEINTVERSKIRSAKCSASKTRQLDYLPRTGTTVHPSDHGPCTRSRTSEDGAESGYHSKAQRGKVKARHTPTKMDYFESITLTAKDEKQQSSGPQSDSEGQEEVTASRSKLSRATQEDLMDDGPTTTSSSLEEESLTKKLGDSTRYSEHQKMSEKTNISSHMGKDACGLPMGCLTLRRPIAVQRKERNERSEQNSLQLFSDEEDNDSPSKGTRTWGDHSGRKRCTSRPRSRFHQTPRKMA